MTSTKDRILQTAARLFRRQGYAATGLKQIVAEAKAPFGSLYHFFPGGKEALGVAVLRSVGPTYKAVFDQAFDQAPDLASGLARMFEAAADNLRRTSYADACPIALIALEVSGADGPLRDAAAEVFEDWIASFESRLLAAGLPPEAARSQALAALSALEGALVFAKTLRRAEIVETAGRQAAAEVARALGLKA